MAEIAGLKLIVPSSVAGSGVSVSASGKVSFTAATSVSVNGCFTSTYDNYLVVMQCVPSADRTFLARLRNSGSDISTSTYAWQYLIADSTAVAGDRSTSQSNTRIGDVFTSLSNGYHVYFYGPYLTQPTAIRSVTVDCSSGAALKDYASTQSDSSAYDGFTIYLASGNLTGALTIYGLNQ